MYDKTGNIKTAWFGGGTDLTPYYLDEEDAKHFHQVNKNVCDKHDTSYYPNFKKECDAYFYNSHRDECRGIGGIFFDYQKENDHKSMQEIMNFSIDSGNAFLEAYLPILEKHIWKALVVIIILLKLNPNFIII